jgi:hypothetical protein
MGYYLKAAVLSSLISDNQQELGSAWLYHNPKLDQSGIIINAASYDWCSYRGIGGQDGDKIKRITYNAIKKLLRGERIFSQ